MSETPPLCARIGIDWGDRTHAVALLESGSVEVEKQQLAHTPEAIAEWAAALRERFGGGPIGICLETSNGPLVHALLQLDFVVLFPVNPRALKRFREAFIPAGAKDDPDDAGLLLELLDKHEDRLHRWLPDDAETRALGRLAVARRKAVDHRTRIAQELRAELKSCFPQALEWTGSDLVSRLATDFLLRWPSLDSVQRARPTTIRRFYYARNCRRGDIVERRIEEIRTARPLTTDPAVIEPSILTVQLLAGQIRMIGDGIARYEQEIDDRFNAHPDADLFRALPGSGPNMGPRLVAAFGARRERFESAEDIQQLSGIAPVTKRSGKSCSIVWRWGAPTFLRQTFHEFARLSISRSAWAGAYYQQQRERGSDYHAAVRALAFKWIRILYRCWASRTPYSEARYLAALRRNGSPLAERLGPAKA